MLYREIESKVKEQGSQLEQKAKYPILKSEYKNGECLVKNVTLPYGYVERYGAIGDRITDSTEAIQNAFDCASAENCNVYFGIGGTGNNFRISKTLFINNSSLQNIYFNNSRIIPLENRNFTNGFMMMCNSDDGINVKVEYFARRLTMHQLWLNGENKKEVKGIFIADRTELNRFFMQFMYNQFIEYADHYIDRVNIHDGTIMTDDATDYPNRKEYCIVLNNGCGNNGTIRNIEFSTGADRYRKPVKAIRMTGKMGATFLIDNIMNGEIYIKNQSCTLSRIHGEAGSIILENAKVKIKDSELYNESFDHEKTFDTIIIKDYNGISQDVVIENCAFNYFHASAPVHEAPYIQQLKFIVINETCNSNVYLKNCYWKGTCNHPHTSVGVWCWKLTNNEEYVSLGFANGSECIVNINGVFENTSFTKPTSINESLCSIFYNRTDKFDWQVNPNTNLSRYENNPYYKFYGKSGEYTFKIFALCNDGRKVGFEIPCNFSMTVENDTTKVFAFKFNFNVKNWYIRIYVYVDGVAYNTCQFRFTNNNGIAYYNGRDINGVQVYSFGSEITMNDNFTKFLIKENNSCELIGTLNPTRGSWEIGDIFVDYVAKKIKMYTGVGFE